MKIKHFWVNRLKSTDSSATEKSEEQIYIKCPEDKSEISESRLPTQESKDVFVCFLQSGCDHIFCPAVQERPSDHPAERVAATPSDPALRDRKDGDSWTHLKEDEPENKGKSETSLICRQSSLEESRKTICLDQDQNHGLDPVSDGRRRNLADVDRTLEQVLSDDPSTSEVNLNNMDDVPQETLLRFADALRTNTHIQVFSLANTHADDRVAFAIAKMLPQNRFITNLNIESNFVSGQGVLALLGALQHNQTLTELRFHNQRHICGGKVEMEMVTMLRQNTTLLKLGYQFHLPGPRMTATNILTRNQDQQRQRRLRQKSQQMSSPGPGRGLSADNRPSEKSIQVKSVDKQNKNPSPPPSGPPIRKTGQMVKQHEGLDDTQNQPRPRNPRQKNLKNSPDNKDSGDLLRDPRDVRKPSWNKRREEPKLPPPQRSSHDDLMAAIRASSIRSLKRVGGRVSVSSWCL